MFTSTVDAVYRNEKLFELVEVEPQGQIHQEAVLTIPDEAAYKTKNALN